MNSIERFSLDYNKYTSKRISEEHRREYTIGWIQGLMVLSAIIFPMLAIMLSPSVIKVSPLMLGGIILTTTIIGLVIWLQFESKPDFTEERIEEIDNKFKENYCPDTLRKELVEKYKARLHELQLEVKTIENKKVYYQMIERIQDYQRHLSSIRLSKDRYSYYTLHQYIYFYHMFDSVKSFRYRNENYFEPSNDNYSY